MWLNIKSNIAGRQLVDLSKLKAIYVVTEKPNNVPKGQVCEAFLMSDEAPLVLGSAEHINNQFNSIIKALKNNDAVCNIYDEGAIT